MAMARTLLLAAAAAVLLATTAPTGLCDTNAIDADALRDLMQRWRNYPSSWSSGDPCEEWDGVICSGGRVTSLRLSSINLQGTLSSSVGLLTQLVFLDLSSNIGLSGPLPAEIGNLGQLTTLILYGCSFTGEIPKEIGNLPKLWFLALNSNKFTGAIPPSIGLLSNLYYLDLADNQLTGHIPISSPTSPGLDLLVQTKHFHFNKNQLTGTLTGLFNSNMTLLHILFDSNQLTGLIPAELGSITTLEVVRLDRNGFLGAIPSSISKLVGLKQLNLASNKLTGSVPDLSSMTKLNVVDLSNNTFYASVAPLWFTTLTSLTSVSMASGNLSGQVPKELFTLPQLQQVVLRNNALNGTLEMTGTISSQLRTVNLRDNRIIYANIQTYNDTLVQLVGNPLCADQDYSGRPFCSIRQQDNTIAYTTSTTQCSSSSSAAQCPDGQSLDPASCGCAFPYSGRMVFRAPFFADVTAAGGEPFRRLETSLSAQLGLRPGAVYLSDVHWDSDSYLQVQVRLFPSSGVAFNMSELLRIGFDLSNQTYVAPPNFGPYFFNADPHSSSPPLLGADGNKSKNTTLIKAVKAVGGVLAGVVFIIIIACVSYRCSLKKRRTKKPTQKQDPQPIAHTSTAANNTPHEAAPPHPAPREEAPRRDGDGDDDDEGAPQVDWPRFTMDELNECTDSFSDGNKVGEGGFGSVYRGTLRDGTAVAIKRAKAETAPDLAREIMAMHRLHHRNLIRLVGYYYEKGELMIVSEFVSNGNLQENLRVRSESMNWHTRLRIALDSARGLAYLHEHIHPAIIHRDIKSSNILLDDNREAKIADFGISKLLANTNESHVFTLVKGTLGYLDPEYVTTNELSKKSDVYSFGIVMLTLVSGREPVQDGENIADKVRRAVENHDRDGLSDLVDRTIRDDSACTAPALQRFLRLALRCASSKAAARPFMGAVVKELEAILQSSSPAAGDSSSSSSSTSESEGAGGSRRARIPAASDAEGVGCSSGGSNTPDHTPFLRSRPSDRRTL